MLGCRPITKRMATREELARIGKEFKAVAEAGHTCTLSAARSFHCFLLMVKRA
jgi:hypothetical protein